MKDPVFDADHSFGAALLPNGQRPSAAVVLARTDTGGLHSGLLYRDGAQLHILHLGWENNLLDENNWDGCRLWAVPPLEPEDLRAVAGMCRRISARFQQTRHLPYGLGFHGSSFDEHGNLQPAVGARGLTCATFVLAVFHSVQRELVVENTWPADRRQEDLKFLVAATAFGRRAHLERLREELEGGLRRIHPHELLGACLGLVVPATFTDANAAGLSALEILLDRLISESRL